MTKEELELHERISAFAFDEGQPELPFSARLARDNGWGSVYAVRVLEEYRKFTFLMVAAGHITVPSDQVDQAWHQHLLYTRSWSDFCKVALRRSLHHEPSRGGRGEKDRFEAGYNETLQSYRRFFGEPPEDIWPGAGIRFGRDLHFRRVNTERFLIIPRSRLIMLGLIAGALLTATLLAWVS